MASAFLATLAVPLTPAQEVSLSELSSELRFLLSENDVPEVVQLRLRILGHKTMPLFSVLADTRALVRDLVTRDIVDAAEVGLTVMEVQQARLVSNQVVATWLVASQRLVEEIRISTLALQLVVERFLQGLLNVLARKICRVQCPCRVGCAFAHCRCELVLYRLAKSRWSFEKKFTFWLKARAKPF